MTQRVLNLTVLIWRIIVKRNCLAFQDKSQEFIDPFSYLEYLPKVKSVTGQNFSVLDKVKQKVNEKLLTPLFRIINPRLKITKHAKN